jgi:hypothetical protein
LERRKCPGRCYPVDMEVYLYMENVNEMKEKAKLKIKKHYEECAR